MNEQSEQKDSSVSKQNLISKAILASREKYAELAKKHSPRPSTFEIIKEDQVLFYFGANHSPNPDDPQYPLLKEYWNKLLKETEGKDRMVLIEGGLRHLFDEEEKAIKNGSEGALITMFAHQEKISIASPDINQVRLIELLPEIPVEEMLLTRFLSWVDNFHLHRDPKPDFEKSAQSWCEWHNKNKTWKNIDVNLPMLKDLYKEILGKDFDENDYFNDMINPNKTGTRINEISRAQSNLRDINIVSEIARYWDAGKSIFVVFGSGHLIVEESALKEVLK